MGWIVGVLAISLLVIIAYALRQSGIPLRLLCNLQSLEEYVTRARQPLSRKLTVNTPADYAQPAASNTWLHPSTALKPLQPLPQDPRQPFPEPITPGQARTASHH